MMKHPDDEKLVRYVSRQNTPGEMIAVILHLESCQECAAKVQNLSAFENPEQMSLMENDAIAFHLDYDEHLRPFVDHEADAATREIVETHVQDCGACAFEVRELREFSESLRLREIEKTREVDVSIFRRAKLLFGKLSHNLALPIAGALILLLLTAMWLLIRRNQTSVDAEVAKHVNPVPENRASSVSPTPEVQPLNDNSNVVLPTNKIPEQSSLKPGGRQEKINSNANPFGLNDIEVDRFDDLPEQFQENIRSAISSGRLTVPAKLVELAVIIKPRGGGSEENLSDISPDREIVKETKPKFRWKVDSLEDELYVVEIFDERNDSVAVSPKLKQNFWTPEKPLEAGKSYQWELRVKRTDWEAEKTVGVGKFSILDSDARNKIKNLKSAPSLQRGIIYASLGLIKDARREFRIAAANSPKNNARKFLRQLEKYR